MYKGDESYWVGVACVAEDAYGFGKGGNVCSFIYVHVLTYSSTYHNL